MTNTTIATFGKCTLYRSGMFGYTRVECREATLMHGPYGQHEDVPKLRFVRKGRRNPESYILDSSRAVILEGHGHPKSLIAMWDRDFDAALAVYVSETGTKVLADTAVMA